MDRVRGMTHRFGQYLIELNYFQSMANDEQSIRNERWSTRLYILLLSGSLLILILYSGLAGHMTTIQVNSPSLDIYKQLQNTYGIMLQCPCSQIAISYQKFVQFEVSLHEVCSSNFIDQQWINYLFNENISYYFAVDFRGSATGQFQMLAALCRIAMDAINNGLEEFYSTELINFHVLNSITFEALIQASVSEFKATIPHTFSQAFKIVRAMTFGNQLMSAFESNAIFEFYQFSEQEEWKVALRSGFYYRSDSGWCYCSYSATCYTSAAFYDFMADDDIYKYYSYNYFKPQAYVDGWQAGCFPVETLLLSSFACFYNATCLDSIRSFINSSMIGNVTPLLSSVSSRFPQNITLDSIVQELFIEALQANLSFESYFNECQPLSCTYSITKYWNILLIVTTILGLYGGLTVVLRLIVPYLILILSRLRRPTVTEENTQQNPDFSLTVWIRTWCHRLLYSLQTLNLFTKPHLVSTPHQLHNQRLSTRLYIILLVLSLTVLFFYTFIDQQNRTIEVFSPSLNTYERLEKYYGITLQCPCAQLSVPYGNFLQLTPLYHSVCNSDFVSEKWITWLLNAQIYEPVLAFADFRTTSPALFQMLADFCVLADEIVDDALRLFYNTQFISAQLLTSTVFGFEMASATDQFQASTPNDFLRLVDFIRNMTYVNQLVSWSRQNIDVYVWNQTTGHLAASIFIRDLESTNGTQCACAIDPTCKQLQGFFEYESTMNTFNASIFIPGFFAACFPVESLLQSTLECFYSPVCLETIRSYVTARLNAINQTTTWNFTALNPNILNHSSPSTTMDFIVNNLFVESWSSNISYALYFSNCHPSSCIYTVIERSTIVAVITRIVGLFGGLSVTLQLIIPFVITFIRGKQRAVAPDNSQLAETSLVNRITRAIRQLRVNIVHLVVNGFQKLYQMFVTLNLFRKPHTAQIEYEVRFQRWTTRLYIVLLLTTFFILILYTAINVQPTTIQVNRPSLSIYHDLESAYDATLVCTCSQISIPYKQFVFMKPSFHQICSSDFITKQWITYLFNNVNNSEGLLSSQDFRVNSVPQFQALLSFCELATQAVSDELRQFLETSVVSAHFIPSEQFTLEIESAIKLFRLTVPRTFLSTLKLIRNTTQGNALISAYTTNWRLSILHEMSYATVYTKSLQYGDCDCATSPFCVQPSILYEWTVPGFQVGCLPVESLLQSTLECLYDSVCLDTITLFISNSTGIFNALDLSLPTNFAPNTTLNTIVESLFIESWITNISFDNYYNECQLSACIYTIASRQSISFLITTIMGLYGGLTVALRLLTPIVVHIARKLIVFRRVIQTAPAPTN